MNKELIEAINLLEKENNISKDVLLEAIENSLLTAYKNNYGRADNVKVNINRETGDFSIVAVTIGRHVDNEVHMESRPAMNDGQGIFRHLTMIRTPQMPTRTTTAGGRE